MLGGGLRIWKNHPIVFRNLIYGNNATKGGGIYVGHQIISEPQFINNTIYGNNATESGGGLYLGSAACNLTNEIMWNNAAPDSPGIFIYGSSTVEVNYSLVEGWVGPGSGNFDEDHYLLILKMATSISPWIHHVLTQESSFKLLTRMEQFAIWENSFITKVH